MTSSSISFFFFLVLCERAACATKQYVYVNQYMSWQDAQNYCRQNHKDLATVSTVDENSRSLKLAGTSSSPCWIGLKRSASDPNTWQWSDGERLSLFNWNIVDALGTDCVQLDIIYGWSRADCTIKYPFICYRNIILVKENKTWEDALQHCRIHYTDLALAYTLKNPVLLENEAVGTQTVNVWTGLRFLDGKWFWVNMQPVDSPDALPSCPAKNYRCGARNIKTHVWENRDCNEKFNFLCIFGGAHL
ncbi:macrophage mannose receptor 1-like [Hemibagrus wyckioides]|uniref:macrophage mannose receptor 1-like n=1 Tax=Hemibagrus wyckioides TaxID=337641 RepID=UPI00266D7586|nr:macrophage mannose receptor 1-like [Hemibagrus wyckioides]